jgi:hypothetical protein
MEFITSIAKAMEALSIDNHTHINDSSAFCGIVVNKVKENHRVLPALMPKLAEQVNPIPISFSF